MKTRAEEMEMKRKKQREMGGDKRRKKKRKRVKIKRGETEGNKRVIRLASCVNSNRVPQIHGLVPC